MEPAPGTLWNDDLYSVRPGPRGFPAQSVYRGIKLVVFDVDGVLTDGRIIIDDKGTESKFFDVRDGAGITLLRLAGLKVALITGRSSAVVDHRAREIKIPPEYVKQGAKVKLPVLRQMLTENAMQAQECAFVGDDLIDTDVLEVAGLACCPTDAHAGAMKQCHVVANLKGGHGGVRAIAEHILKTRADGSWEMAVGKYMGKI